MSFRKYALSAALSLALLTPAAANGHLNNPPRDTFPNSQLVTTAARAAATELYANPDTELAPEVKAQMKALKEKFKNGEITKEQFHQEMKKLFPEGYEPHKGKGHHKKLSDEDKAKLQELKTKFDNGEMDKEEFIKQKKALFQKDSTE